MLRTSAVGDAFWAGRAAAGSSVHSSGDKLFSYSTVILQRLPNGEVIGNKTKYSVTTSKHQSQVGLFSATRFVTGVPRGTTDLRPFLKRKSKNANPGRKVTKRKVTKRKVTKRKVTKRKGSRRKAK